MVNKSNFNKEQYEAIVATEKNVVIVAPPGSGKTHTMIGAIQHYVDNNTPKRVVAVTFTKKAAAEMKERLFNTSVVHTSTIHSWSYTELHKLSRKHGFKVRIMQEGEIQDILLKIMDRLDINKRSLFSLYHFVMGNFNIDVPDYMKRKFMAASDAYIKYKRERHLYDFTDLPLYLKTKLEDYDEYIENVDALFVDEFQDVDPIQLEVFERVVTNKRFYIGDPDQAIYIFRGACSDVFHSLQEFKIHNLQVNYRSNQEILNYATSFRNRALESIDFGGSTIMSGYFPINKSDIIANKGSGGVVLIEDEGDCIAYGRSETNYFYMEDAIQDSISIDKPQVLCRTNKQVKKVKELGYAKVSTIHQAKGLEYDNVMIVDFEVGCEEDINVAYVAATRPRQALLIVNFDTLCYTLRKMPKADKNTMTTKMLF